MKGMLEQLDRKSPLSTGAELHSFATELFPICRSITGEGTRQTLAKIGERIPLTISEVPTGTEVFDWTVPKEWNIRDAYIRNLQGDRVVDFQRNNLHVMNYSSPVHTTLPLKKLRPASSLSARALRLDSLSHVVLP